MKRNHLGIAISTIAVCIIAGLVCVSCANIFEHEKSQVSDEISQEESFDNLINDLQQMTEAFMLANNNPTTRKNWFSRLWDAVKADVKVITNWNYWHPHPDCALVIPIQDTSAASSNAYYNEGFIIPVYDDDDNVINTVDSLSRVYAYAEEKYSIARAHNAAVLGMIKSNSFDPNSTLNTVIGIRNAVIELGITTLDKSPEESANYVDEFMSNNYSNLSGTTKPSTENDRAVYLIDNYLENVQQLNSPETVKSYTKNYIETIENDTFFTDSEINKVLKQYVIEMVGLGAASYDLWYHISMINQ